MIVRSDLGIVGVGGDVEVGVDRDNTGDKVRVLVMRDRRTKALSSVTVPCKGVGMGIARGG